VSVPLPAAVSGERFEFSSSAGMLSAYVAGHGPPMLLVHSVNAAASAAEVRTLYEHYRQTRTVFAIDLPGYGFSERGNRAYTPRLMTDALHAMAAQMRLRCGAVPIDALALSLSSEFLARSAVEDDTLWRSLALVSPTGFNRTRARRATPGSTMAMPWLLHTLRGPGWGGALFRGLTRPSVIRYFLERTWVREGHRRGDVALRRDHDPLRRRRTCAAALPGRVHVQCRHSQRLRTREGPGVDVPRRTR
jgi:pimeloyl-ACP methyl ester carboxylesterase